jgi:hypothetical protein
LAAAQSTPPAIYLLRWLRLWRVACCSTTRPEGRNDWGLFDGYAQPRLVAFSSRDAHLVITGGVDGGLFISTDSGINWKALTRPVSGVANPEIVRPLAAYFDTSNDGGDIYVSTQGSGVWRITEAGVGEIE